MPHQVTTLTPPRVGESKTWTQGALSSPPTFITPFQLAVVALATVALTVAGATPVDSCNYVRCASYKSMFAQSTSTEYGLDTSAVSAIEPTRRRDPLPIR